MTELKWDQVGEREYETGVDHGVLYIPDNTGHYNNGYAWNGLTTVTESPSGAESTPQYADNIKYLNLVSAELFGGTIEAFTYPEEFAQCDGSAEPEPGVSIGQQGRRTFGLSYRTIKGNDLAGNDHGYKIHLVYGATAAPSEKAYGTVNDSPEAIAFSWEITTTPVEVPGYKPSSTLVIDSTKVSADNMSALEELLYGTDATDPSLPLPEDVLAIFALPVATPVAPTYVQGTHTLTIPATTGVVYKIGGVTQTAGNKVITQDTTVTASPDSGHAFPVPAPTSSWNYQF